MTEPALQTLVRVSSTPLCLNPPRHGELSFADTLHFDLASLLRAKNGFIAFEGALLVLPSSAAAEVPSLLEWNAPDSWRHHYGELGPAILFFAMDVFANQFGLMSSGEVVRFDPESGSVELHATSLAAWADKVRGDFEFETGWTAAKSWQEENRPLLVNERLLPRTPFILGGDYVAANLVAIPLVEAMQKLGSLYQQVREVPDGTKITLTGWI